MIFKGNLFEFFGHVRRQEPRAFRVPNSTMFPLDSWGIACLCADF